MSGALRIESAEWRVCQEGCTTFATERQARDFAAELEARTKDLPHLGRVTIQMRWMTVTAGHWQTVIDEQESTPDDA